MRLVGTIGAVFIALATAGAAEAAAPCKPKPHHRTVRTLAANDLVRLYKVVEHEDAGYVYACERATGWRKRLGLDDSSLDDFEVHARLKGNVVAYSEGCGACRENYRFSGHISVLDMATHHHTFVYRHSPEGKGYVTDLVLKRNGSVGWISADEGGYVVRRHGRGGLAELDAGGKIDPGSLTLDRSSVLHWVHDGEPRSAPLD